MIERPKFMASQLVSASDAAKYFGSLRKKAKELPQFVTENGNVDTVILDYDYFEKMYMRLMELEEKEEAGILLERINRFEQNPNSSIPWRSVRQSGVADE